MKRILFLFVLLLCFAGKAKAQSEVAHFPADPPTCDPTRGLLYYNTTTQKLMSCTALNTWTVAGGGGTPAVTSPTGSIIYAAAASYNLRTASTMRDCSLVSGTPNVTCPSATFTKNFQVGDYVWSLGAAGNGFILNSTILSITDDTHLVANANASGTCTGNCWTTVGPDATASLKASFADAQAACTKNDGVTWQLPAGDLIVTTGGFNVQPGPCTAGGGAARTSITVSGVDSTNTRFILHPTLFAYNGTDCTTQAVGAQGIVPTGNICFFAGVRNVQHLQFWGVNGVGSGTGQSSAYLMATGAIGLNYKYVDVKCMYVNIGGGFFFGQSDNIVSQIESDGCGSTVGLDWNGNGSIVDGFIGDASFVAGFRGLRVTGGNLIATGVRFGNLTVPTGPLIEVVGTLTCVGCLAPSGGDVAAGTQLFNVAGTGNLYLFGGLFDLHNAANVRALNLNTGSNTHLCGTQFNVTQGGGVFINAAAGANVFDDCPNTITFTTFETGGPVNTFGPNNIVGKCTGVATASQTLGLYGTGANVTASTCTSTTVGNGIIQSRARTLGNLVITATAGGVNASSGVVTVLKNGGATTITCTIGTGTSCSDITHTVSVAAGDLVSIQFTTQAAETLAGVSAQLWSF